MFTRELILNASLFVILQIAAQKDISVSSFSLSFDGERYVYEFDQTPFATVFITYLTLHWMYAINSTGLQQNNKRGEPKDARDG